MEAKTAKEILKAHQNWRLGNTEEMSWEPKQLTQAIDTAIETLSDTEWVETSIELPKDSDGKVLAMDNSGNVIVTRAREEDGLFKIKFVRWCHIPKYTPPTV